MSAATLNSDQLRLPTDPLLPGQVVRLYSMRMCPYAQRARLIVAAKKVGADIINVDLNKKPDWFFDYNPYGEVPLLIHNNGHVYESIITAEYLEEAFAEPKLYSSDPQVRAHEKIYFNHWSKKGIPAFYSLLQAGWAEPTQTQRLMDHVLIMEKFLVKLETPYFSGEKPGFSDYMIWPWFERMPVLKEINEFQIEKSVFPRLMKWMENMLNDRAVKECSIDIGLMIEHYAKYRTGKPDFTIGAAPSKPVQEALENLDGLRDPNTRDRKA